MSHAVALDPDMTSHEIHKPEEFLNSSLQIEIMHTLRVWMCSCVPFADGKAETLAGSASI